MREPRSAAFEVDAASAERLSLLADNQEPLARLVAELARRAPAEGRHASPWPGLTFFRAEAPTERFPVVYEPSVCVVAQGSKQAFLGDEAYRYDSLRYLVLSVPLPVSAQIVEASPERPFLSLALRLDSAVLSELLLEMGSGPAPAGLRPAISVSTVEPGLLGAVQRLLSALDQPQDLRVLAPLAEREILYRLLSGEQGDLLRAVAHHDSRGQRIAAALRFLWSHFDQPLDIATIARSANLSPSAFHHTFKAVTSVSPLQYLKQIRLHQARLLMLHEGLSAAEAAFRVGYGSPSQFSREFRRLFGAPPARQVQTLRAGAQDESSLV